jgi:hypothetical protein
MSTKAIAPRCSEDLFPLTLNRLQRQTARSGALDGRALGVILLGGLVACIITTGARGMHELWILGLVLLGLSFGLAFKALRNPGAEQIGPCLGDVRKARETQDDRTIREWVLDDLLDDVEANEQALARKGPLVRRALTFMVLAILVDLAGLVLQ